MTVEIVKIRLSLGVPEGVNYGSVKIGDSPTVFNLTGPPEEVEQFLNDLLDELEHWRS